MLVTHPRLSRRNTRGLAGNAFIESVEGVGSMGERKTVWAGIYSFKSG
jgi:hypothetical protein